MEEDQNQIQKKSLSIKNLGTYLFKEIKKKHRLKLKGNKQMAPRGISPVITRPGSRINELQERGAKIKRALQQFAPELNNSEIFEQEKNPSIPVHDNKENQQNSIDATSLHKLVNERLGASTRNRLSVSASGFHNDARTPPCTPLKSKSQTMPTFFSNADNKITEQQEITVENTVCTSKAPIMEDEMDEDFHETNNPNENDTGVRIQISESHGDSDFEDEEQHQDAHEDETEDDERLRQVLCTFFPHSTSVSVDNAEHIPRRARTFTRSDVSHALDMLCSSPDRRKTNILNSSTGSLPSLGWNPLAQNTSSYLTTPYRRNFQQEDLSLSPLSIKSPISSTPSSTTSSTSKDRKYVKKNRTFSFSSLKK